MIVRNFLLGLGFLLLAGVQCRRVERHQQLGLEPDYASRRRIRDVEAEDETSDARFIETHASASAGAISENMDAPVSEEDVEAKAVKAKLLMQAESLGISNAEEYAEKVVQQAQEQGKDSESNGELSEEAIHQAEIELAGLFSGVISAVMSNVIREQPQLLSDPDSPQQEL